MLEIGAQRRGILEELEKAHVYISQLNEALLKQQAIIDKKDKEIKGLHRRMEAQEERIQKIQASLGM